MEVKNKCKDCIHFNRENEERKTHVKTCEIHFNGYYLTGGNKTACKMFVGK